MRILYLVICTLVRLNMRVSSFVVLTICFIICYFNGHKDVQAKILKCKGVNGNFQAKQISEKNKDKIDIIDSKARYDILFKCIKLKAEQCELFKKKLIESRGKYLVEFAWWGDKEYGCVLEDGIFRGKNACGRLMMKVREELYYYI